MEEEIIIKRRSQSLIHSRKGSTRATPMSTHIGFTGIANTAEEFLVILEVAKFIKIRKEHKKTCQKTGRYEEADLARKRLKGIEKGCYIKRAQKA